MKLGACTWGWNVHTQVFGHKSLCTHKQGPSHGRKDGQGHGRWLGSAWEALCLKPYSGSGSELLGVREVWLKPGLLEHEWILLLVLFVTFKLSHTCLLPPVPLAPSPINVKRDLFKIILKLQAGKELTTRKKKKSIRVRYKFYIRPYIEKLETHHRFSSHPISFQ